MALTTLQLSDPSRRVTYRLSGQGAPLVLIHGVGMQSAAWGPQIAALSTTNAVYALDMPGHGGSDPLPMKEPGLEDYVAWLAEVLAALDLPSVSLAGHSMGALIAGGFAASCPDRVSRVALLNGVFRRDVAAREAVTARAAAIREGEFDLETPLTRWFGDSVADQAARAQVAGWLSAVNPEGYADAYGAFAKGDAVYADRFADIRCPLLAITGEGDPNSTPAMSQAMADAAPQGRAEVVAGHRHMVNLTAPGQISDLMATWLATPVKEAT